MAEKILHAPARIKKPANKSELGKVLSTQFVAWSELYGEEWSHKKEFFWE